VGSNQNASYDESAAAADIWVHQAMDCPGSQGADLSRWDCGLACDNVPLSQVHVFQNAVLDTFGIAAIKDDECLLALRGSKSETNALEDVDILQQNPWGDGCKGCLVHDGFYRAWQSLRHEAHEALDAMGCSQKTLRVTGHSLGGSMAALAAFEMTQWYQISAVYTYGQPRTGNSQWVAAFASRLAGVPFFRVTDFKDPIPQWIMHNMFMQGWEHQWPEVYYDSPRLGAFTVCEGQDRHWFQSTWTCSSQWGVVSTEGQGCFHCSYLGMNPCTCGNPVPECGNDDEYLI
jgi:hypothetical protein